MAEILPAFELQNLTPSVTPRSSAATALDGTPFPNMLSVCRAQAMLVARDERRTNPPISSAIAGALRRSGRSGGRARLSPVAARFSGIMITNVMGERMTASAEDTVAVAPSDEDVHRPNPRPIQAGCPVEEGSPEPLHRRGVEPHRSDGLRVSQGPVHGVLQTAPDPAIERQHKSALGPLEQRRVKAAQTDA